MIPTLPIDLAPEELPASQTLPWSAREAWLGVGLMVCLTIVALFAASFWRESLLFQTLGLVILELIYLLPILGLIFWRKISWGAFGLNRFNLSTVGIGCGLMLGGFVIIAIHNLILLAFNLQPQGLEIQEILKALKSPLGLVIAGVFVAPFSEELFFRGFLFGGLEQRYGWKKAALVSSLIFACFHLDLASLVPTFILGAIFAFLFHQSKSIWPGILLHFLTNAVGIGLALALAQLPSL